MSDTVAARYTTEVHRTLAQLVPPLVDVAPDDNLFDRGLTSLGVVHMIVALESALGVEIPDGVVTIQDFTTVESVVDLLGRIEA